MLKKIINRCFKIFCKVGGKEALVDTLNRILLRLGLPVSNKHFYRFVDGYSYPLCYRFGTSDESSFNQVFIRREFHGFGDIENAELIIDCGAYVGYTSIYFLNTCPKAYVISVEPDYANFKVCEKNLRPYAKRTLLLNRAIWTHETPLLAYRERNSYGEWSARVRECKKKEKGNVVGIDLLSLLKNSGFKKIDVLKIDIEGTEYEIFSNNFRPWLDKVKNIYIEIHNRKCEEIFMKALSDYKFELSKWGELTVCKNIAFKNS
jgi:FkbM family methyltransferase